MTFAFYVLTWLSVCFYFVFFDSSLLFNFQFLGTFQPMQTDLIVQMVGLKATPKTFFKMGAFSAQLILFKQFYFSNPCFFIHGCKDLSGGTFIDLTTPNRELVTVSDGSIDADPTGTIRGKAASRCIVFQMGIQISLDTLLGPKTNRNMVVPPHINKSPLFQSSNNIV